MQDEAAVPHEAREADVALIASGGFRIFQQVLVTAMLDEFVEGLEELATSAATFSADRDDLVVFAVLDVGYETCCWDGQVTMPRDGTVIVPQPGWIFISR